MKLPPLPIAARVRRWRTLEGGAPRALGVVQSLPLTAAPLIKGDALWVAPLLDDRSKPAASSAKLGPTSWATPWELVALLPEPDAVCGALVVLAPAAPRDGIFARMIGARWPIPRAVRGAALLLKGYGAIGGGVDPFSGLDLAWGEGPALET